MIEIKKFFMNGGSMWTPTLDEAIKSMESQLSCHDLDHAEHTTILRDYNDLVMRKKFFDAYQDGKGLNSASHPRYDISEDSLETMEIELPDTTLEQDLAHAEALLDELTNRIDETNYFAGKLGRNIQYIRRKIKNGETNE
jgi:hypothetical protein